MTASAGHGIRKITACVFAALTLFVAAAVNAPRFSAAGEVEVSSAEEFVSAIQDSGVSTININSDRAPFIEFSSEYRISRTLTINGRGAALSAVGGGTLSVDSGIPVTLNNITVGGSEGYFITSNGTVILGDSVVIGGSYGILLRSGSSLTSGTRTVSVAETVNRAVSINAGGGTVTIAGLCIEQGSGSADMVYINGTDGKIALNDVVRIKADLGNGFVCPAGESCPNVNVGSGAALEISAPSAENEGGSGSAIDIRSGSITFEHNSSADIYGSANAVLAYNIDIRDESNLKLSCRVTAGAGSSGVSNAALWAGGTLTLGRGVTLDMMSNALPCNGIYAGKGVSAGNDCRIQICGNGAPYSALCTPQSVTLGDGCTLSAKSMANAVICDHGMTTGSRCTLSFTDIQDYGIYATGTMQADKLYFGEENTITIDAGKCAIYTRESVDITNNSLVELSSSNRAPAIWIDADTTSQGHLAIKSSDVSVRCSASSQAVHNSGVYVVGAVIIDEKSKFQIINNGDFGLIATYGDVNVSTDSSLYASGGCGIYVLHGNLRLTQGGRLYAEGLLDSGVRVEHGVLNAGEDTVMDIQGSRFGAELLGESGLWIIDVKDFDIRSTTDRAVYIQNGTLNISGVDKLSAWLKNTTSSNTSRWWTKDVVDYHSWDIKAGLSDSEKIYADYTMLKPSGFQEYKDGVSTGYTGFDWYNGIWKADQYSRLAIFLSRPTARSNNFFIPSGKSFSWWLNGESYTEGELVFQITTPVKDNSVQLGTNGRFTFNADNYSIGMQEFKYIVIDSEGVSSEEATISVNVTASKPPIACSDTYFTGVSKNIMGQLEMYDYDGRISSTEIAVKPSHGELIISSDGQFSYTPETSFIGIDTFAYFAVDNMNDKSNIGYIAIVVGPQDVPVAPYDTLITESNVSVSFRLTPVTSEEISDIEDGGEGGEDGNADAQTQQPADAQDGEQAEAAPKTEYYYELTRQPQYGKLSFTSLDTVEYVPYEDFSGSDVFCYRIIGSDGSLSNEALVTIATIPNQRPYADSSSYICVSGSKRNGQLSADDVDGSIIRFEIVTKPEAGELELDEQSGRFVYKAPFGYTGSVFFTFTATDNDGLSSHESKVSIEVVSLKEYLRSTGKLKTALAAVTCIIISFIVIIALLISRSVTRRKEKKLEQEREKLLESLYLKPKDDDDDMQ